MIQPDELKLALPMEISGGELSTTTKVWEILRLSHQGELEKIKISIKRVHHGQPLWPGLKGRVLMKLRKPYKAWSQKLCYRTIR